VTQLTAEQAQLATAYRVATEYENWRGEEMTVPPGTVVAVLHALGVDAADDREARRALEAHEATKRDQALPPSVVIRQADDRALSIGTSAEAPRRAWVELEDGCTTAVHIDEAAPGRPMLVLPADLPLGYHQLSLESAHGTDTCALIVTPAFLGLHERIDADRGWGLAAQLYSVRSERSWGVGDLGDLRELARWAAGLGADFLLLNPLSAAEPVPPLEPSPYLPSSRLFVNPVYLAVDQVPEYDELSAADRAAVDDHAAEVRRAADRSDVIDRDAAWSAKRDALRLLYAVARTTDRERSLRDFVDREGDGLRDFATWCALVEEHGNDWRGWPDSYQHPRDDSLSGFREQHADAIGFHCWLQWLLDEQLEAAQRSALEAGMALGIMHDLAVGVHPSGADSWTLQDSLALGVNVGAPPDGFNQRGQDWSQPPWRPDRLAEQGYRPFRALLSRLLRHAGAVRIDHIIGLFRLWWIPQGDSADHGTYVRYDHEAFVGILALEGHRAGAVVVGEDLGNVEPAARQYFAERGILGTSLLWFERDAIGRPLPADRWREASLASVTTHDLPPTAGYLAGDHVQLRESLGLLTRPLAEEQAADEADREAWLQMLRGDGLLSQGADTEETVSALHEFLTRTPARLVCVQLTDAVGDRRTQNQPGTTDEYPNWRVPLCGPDGKPLRLEDVIGSRRARELAETVNRGLGHGTAGRQMGSPRAATATRSLDPAGRAESPDEALI
jgi:4-alpha-glucanotransferase